MADYFVIESNPGGTGTLANPYDGFSSVPAGIQIAGNTLYALDAHTGSFSFAGGGSSGNRFLLRGDWPGRAGSITYAATARTDAAIVIDAQDHVGIMNLPARTTGYNNNAHESAAVTIHNSDGVLIDGLTVASGANHGIFFYSANGDNYTDIEIKNCDIVVAEDGIRWYTAGSSALTTITNLTLTGNSATGCWRGLYLLVNSTSSASCTITNAVINGNSFDDNVKYGVYIKSNHEVTGQFNDLLFFDNTCDRNGVGQTGVGGRGGAVIAGFGSSTGDYGNVEIYGNTFNYNEGLGGGLNPHELEYFRIYDNEASHNRLTGDATFDGVGILIDDNCDKGRVFQNETNENVGTGDQSQSYVTNSGTAIAVYLCDDVWVYANRGRGNRNAFQFGSGTHGPPTNCVVAGNVYDDTKSVGFLGSDQATPGNIVKDNILVATTGTRLNTENLIYSRYEPVCSGCSGGADYFDEDYNLFYGFPNSNVRDDTFGENTDRTTDPSLDGNLRPMNVDLVGWGVVWWADFVDDFEGYRFKSPPTPGAFEMDRRGHLGVRASRDWGPRVRND